MVEFRRGGARAVGGCQMEARSSIERAAQSSYKLFKKITGLPRRRRRSQGEGLGSLGGGQGSARAVNATSSHEMDRYCIAKTTDLNPERKGRWRNSRD